MLCGQVANSAAEREPTDTGRHHDSAGRDETRSLRGRVEVSPGRAALCSRDPRVGVDLDPSHVGEVDHEPALTNAVSGWVVTASAHGDLEPMRAGEVESGGDVSGSPAARDQRRPAVDERVEADARRVVARVLGAQDCACERLLQLVSRPVVDLPILRRARRAPPTPSWATRLGA